MIGLDILIIMCFCSGIIGAACGAWALARAMRPFRERYALIYGDCSPWLAEKLEGGSK